MTTDLEKIDFIIVHVDSCFSFVKTELTPEFLNSCSSARLDDLIHLFCLIELFSDSLEDTLFNDWW